LRETRFGVRKTRLSHSEFIQLPQRIDRGVIEHFGGNDALAGWQAEGEIAMGNDCYYERCRRRFHRYLEKRYSPIEAVNNHPPWLRFCARNRCSSLLEG
jgi:hypothetical protein